MTPAFPLSIRRAQAADLPIVATISANGFMHDLVDAHFSPHHFTYPEQYRAFLLQDFRTRIASPRHVMIVAEQALENGTKEIVGVASWTRVGDGLGVERWGTDSIGKRLERLLLNVESAYVSLFDQTTSLSSIRNFYSQNGNILSSLGFMNRLDLNTLVVSVNHQRMGIGKLLIDWGLRLADEEEIVTALQASPAGLGLYKQKGFQVIGEVIMPEKRDGEVVLGEVRVPVMVRKAPTKV